MNIELLKQGKSFYYLNTESDFPPKKSITYTSEYNGEENLSLWITQLGVTPKEQKQIIKDWVEFIPSMKNLKYLWIQSRVNQEIFDAVCQNDSIVSLYIKWSGVKRIDKLSKL